MYWIPGYEPVKVLVQPVQQKLNTAPFLNTSISQRFWTSAIRCWTCRSSTILRRVVVTGSQWCLHSSRRARGVKQKISSKLQQALSSMGGFPLVTLHVRFFTLSWSQVSIHQCSQKYGREAQRFLCLVPWIRTSTGVHDVSCHQIHSI